MRRDVGVAPNAWPACCRFVPNGFTKLFPAAAGLNRPARTLPQASQSYHGHEHVPPRQIGHGGSECGPGRHVPQGAFESVVFRRLGCGQALVQHCVLLGLVDHQNWRTLCQQHRLVVQPRGSMPSARCRSHVTGTAPRDFRRLGKRLPLHPRRDTWASRARISAWPPRTPQDAEHVRGAAGPMLPEPRG